MQLILAAVFVVGAQAGGHLGLEAASCAARDAATMALLQERTFGPDCEGMCRKLGTYPNCQCPGFNGQPASDDDTRGCHTKYCQDPSAPCPNDAFVNCVSANTKTAALLQWDSVLSKVDAKLNMLLKVARAKKQQSATSCSKADNGARALLQMKAANMGENCEAMCKRIGAYPECACPGFDGQPASSDDTRACYTKYCQDPRHPCPNDPFNMCVDETTTVSALQWKAVMSHASAQLDAMLQVVRTHGTNTTKAVKKF